MTATLPPLRPVVCPCRERWCPSVRATTKSIITGEVWLKRKSVGRLVELGLRRRGGPTDAASSFRRRPLWPAPVDAPGPTVPIGFYRDSGLGRVENGETSGVGRLSVLRHRFSGRIYAWCPSSVGIGAAAGNDWRGADRVASNSSHRLGLLPLTNDQASRASRAGGSPYHGRARVCAPARGGVSARTGTRPWHERHLRGPLDHAGAARLGRSGGLRPIAFPATSAVRSGLWPWMRRHRMSGVSLARSTALGSEG